ncbi:glycerophosphodiester phosphodiesterase family protein [Acidimicrobium ferrooxidans]|nr:glycerophosphodiester phosphodiesterase family protein [Acidimicrobium ferrooxidans]
MTSRLLLLCLFLLPTAGRADQAAVHKALRTPTDGKILVCAHRGAFDKAPQNSLAAIKRAFDLGCDIVEIDIRQTKDGHYVLMHDWTVDRKTRGKGRVHKMTLAQFSKLRLRGATQDPLTQHPPTLIEAFRITRGRGMLYLDWKAGNPRALAKLITEQKAHDLVLVSGAPWSLLPLRGLDKQIEIMPRVYLRPQIGPQLSLYKPRLLHIYLKDVNDKVRARARKGNFRLWINGLGDPDKARDWGPLVEAGAGVIQTNHPAALIAALKKLGKH